MKFSLRRLNAPWLIILAVAFFPVLVWQGAGAQDTYYQGKTITLITSGAPGGGTDLTARLIATTLPKYLPGNPRIVLRSKPGGGGSLALNPFYVRAKPDGLTLMLTSAGSIGMQFTREKVVKYDLNKMRHIGHASHGGAVVVVSNAGMKRLLDPKAEPVVCGSKGGAEAWAYLNMLGQELLGWNLRWILGFKSAGSFSLAFRRGEIDMFGDSRMIKELEQEGKGKGLAQIGIFKKRKFVRRSDFSHVPTMEELLIKAGKKPDGLAWKAYLAGVSPLSIYKLFVAPPGTPDAVMKLLVDAYEKTGRDPKFVESWKKIIGPVLDVGAGSETTEMLADCLSAEPEVVAYMNEMRRKNGVIR